MKVNGTHYRTIWVKETNPHIIEIIDQRFRPHEFVVEELETLDDFIFAIRDMHVRGAGLIGATAAFAMYCATLHAPLNASETFLEKAARIGLPGRIRQSAAANPDHRVEYILWCRRHDAGLIQ